jgi:hypothetical protein
MLSLATARALKSAGLPWTPAQNDFFAFPEHGLDDRVFVLAEMPAGLAQLQGEAIFTFHGAMEWALDYIFTADAVWLPTEAQLRQAVESRLAEPRFTLMAAPDGYTLALETSQGPRTFTAASAEETYAAALLALLGRAPP